MGVVASLPDRAWLEAVGDVDGVTTVVWDLEAPAPTQDIDLVVLPYMDASRTAPAVATVSARWVQLLSAGYENVARVLPEGPGLCNAAGVHDAATAELAVGLAIAALRGFDEHTRAQDRGEWLPRTFRPGLADRRVLLVGYGSIGRSIARRLAPFEVTLTAVASRRRGGDELVDVVHGIDELTVLLPEHDVVVLVVPGGDETAGLMDADALALLPDGALVVNVARGTVLDTEAVLSHAARLRFALDVTDPEPLPADHPLWSAPGVIVSPHVGGVTEAFRPRAVAMIRSQLARLAAGEEPDHLVRRPG